MPSINWSDMWVPSLSLFEIFIRGSVVYLALFLYFRLLRREAGGIGITDVLVIVLVADAVQNAMGSEYRSITEGLVLVATIGFWDYLLDWLGYPLCGVWTLRQAAAAVVDNQRPADAAEHEKGNDHRTGIDGAVARAGD